MCLLILGGTADGRIVADTLHQQGVKLIYSVAGLVRLPALACDIISGGFTQYGGLEAFIQQYKISAVLDITHPYAEKMSRRALESARACGIPCWRFHRQAWQQVKGDNWQPIQSWQDVLPKLKNKKSIFLTAGQVPPLVLAQLIGAHSPRGRSLNDNSLSVCRPKIFLRTAAQPKQDLPESICWVKAIGPFSLEGEKQFMLQHAVDALVSKNSGGDSTSAKLQAARELSLPVYMFTRPQLPPADTMVYSRDACVELATLHF